MINRLPVSIQTLYVDLVDRSWSGSYHELVEAGGSLYKRSLKENEYWYLKMPMVDGLRGRDRYLGPDTEEVRRRVTEAS